MSSTTTRGLLWEMVAPFIRLPLRSPARFFSVVLALVLFLVVISHLVAGSPSRSRQPAAASRSAVAPSGAGGPMSNTSTLTKKPSGPTPTTVAVAFTKAWAQPQLSQSAWWKAVRRTPVDSGLKTALEQTDPTSIPASRLIGPPRLVSSTPNSARVQIRTDGPTVNVILAREAGASGDWVVSNILPVTGQDR